MFQICMHMAEVIVATAKRFAASPAGIFLYAVIPGIIGIFVLLGFLATVLSPDFLPITLPVIIAFNSAAAGYGIVDKGGEDYPLLRTALLASAILMTVAGCLGLLFFCPWEHPFDGQRWLIASVLSISLCYFGAWIATKNHRLNESGRSTIQQEEG